MMFGGRVIETADEEISAQKGIMNMRIRAHRIEKSDEIETSVGLEITHKTFASWQMLPVSLNKSQARQLIGMLEKVIK